MKTKRNIVDVLKERILILDGAMGTMIQRRELTESDFRKDRFAHHEGDLRGNNDVLNLTCPDVIKEIHGAFLEAGADIVETNTFNANAFSQRDYGMEHLVYELARSGAMNAKEMADAYTQKTPDKPRYTLGIIGPGNVTLSMSPDVNHPGYRAVTFDEMVTAYTETIRGLVDGGAELLMIETVFDTLNCKAAIYAARQFLNDKHLSLPLMISGTISDASGRTLSGQTPEAFWYSVAHARPLSVGFNCSLGAKELTPHLHAISNVADTHISVHPNAGLPNAFGEYDESPASMANHIRSFADARMINIAGGCCGTTPDHIAAIAHALETARPRVIPPRQAGTCLSGLEPVRITRDNLFVNIGERTNVTGSKRFARLIKKKKYETALEVAASQVEAGAQIIDINMDEGMLNAAEEMVCFLNLLASEPDISKVPVMIDSSDFEVIVAGLKCVQGKGLVNSISLKEGETHFLQKARIVHSLGAAVVVMAFDEAGQADTPQRKLEICQRSYNLLIEKANYRPEDIVFDPNVFAVGTGIDAHRGYATAFFDGVRAIKAACPGALTSGGISNVSFSFRGNNPIREAINSAFLYHAIQAGLDMGIVNPEMLTIYDDIPTDLRRKVEDVLFDRSDDAVERLVDVADTVVAAEKKTDQDKWRALPATERITHSLVRGIATHVATDVNDLLQEIGNPISVIEGPLMAGMEAVGELFGDGKMFLPQVVKSARVMKKAVDILLPHIEKNQQDDANHSAGKVVLATVKGDVHDIGKNIVAIVLQCNNYNVVDLGVMVPTEKILDAVAAEQADILGLSGLITPSLLEIQDIAREMERRGLTIPLIVGGATTSETHTAVKIAPAYSGTVVHVKDASLAVPCAGNLLSSEKKRAYIETIQQHYTTIRTAHERRTANRHLISLEDARKNRLQIDFDTYPPTTPAMTGERVIRDYPIEKLIPFIDWTFFFNAWEMKGRYPAILTDAHKGKEATTLWTDAHEILADLTAQRVKGINGVFAIHPAAAVGDDIHVFRQRPDTKTPASPDHIIYNVRQQADTRGKAPSLCLSDFVAPAQSDHRDHVGFFAVTSGTELVRIADAHERAGDDYSAIMVRLLADRLAEAFAEALHLRVRRTHWGYAPNEDLDITALLRTGYDGIRPAPGYPACPDHSQKTDFFELLEVSRQTGITLTENFAMMPVASVCGYYFAHPQSRYFAIGKITPEQVADYAKRKGISTHIAARWLAPNLA